MAVPALTIPAAVGLGAASGIVGGLFNMLGISSSNAASREQMIWQNKFNQQMLERQFDMQKEMWNLENDYNTPASQVQRLQAAGLSPYLAYSNAAAGGTASHMTAPSAMRSASYEYRSPITAVADVVSKVVPYFQQLAINDEHLKQEQAKTGSMKELLWSQIAKNNQAATLGSLKSSYQNIMNEIAGKYGLSNAQLQNAVLNNRATATTYDKMLNRARLSNYWMTNQVLDSRRQLNDQTIGYNNQFGYNGRLDWQGSLINNGIRGVVDIVKTMFNPLGKLFGRRR